MFLQSCNAWFCYLDMRDIREVWWEGYMVMFLVVLLVCREERLVILRSAKYTAHSCPAYFLVFSHVYMCVCFHLTCIDGINRELT